MATRTVTFPAFDPSRFAEDVKARVAEYFAARRISPKANAAMVVKTVVLAAALIVPYAVIMSEILSPLAMWGLCALMGVAVAGIGFGVSHDALHGAYSRSPRLNALIGYSFDVLGANGYMWRITHNVIHHTYTNIHGLDEDLDVSPLLRLSPHSPHRWVHRLQSWYALGAYSLATLNWVFWKDFDYFLRRRIGPYQRRRHPPHEVATLLAGKLFYLSWSIVLPLALLPLAWWQVAIGFVTMHVVAGAILGIVFQLAHVVEETAQPLPDPLGNMDRSWMLHEMLTTANFCTGNRALSWYVGGLNFQIEHHLFPKTCSVHYPAISRIVRDVARQHGVPYYENPTLFRALRSHWAMLKRLGRGESAPAPGGGIEAAAVTA